MKRIMISPTFYFRESSKKLKIRFISIVGYHDSKGLSINKNLHSTFPKYVRQFSSDNILEAFERFRKTNRKYKSKFDKKYNAYYIPESGIPEKVSLSLPEILSASKINTRDFISLPLTSNLNVFEGAVDSDIGKFAPCILPREKSIVCSVGHLKALIQRSSCFIFDTHKPSVQLSTEYISKQIKKNHEDHQQHFELVVLDAILSEVCGCLERKAMIMTPVVDNAVEDLITTDLSRLSLRKILPIRDALSLFNIMTTEVLQCLEDLINNDEDMLGFLLTERHSHRCEGKELDLGLHTEVELLLESYHRQLSMVRDNIFILKRKLQHSQELAAINLDLYRNAMIKLDVKLNLGMLSLAGVGTVAGIFGMNLESGLETAPGYFYFVSGAALFCSFGVFQTLLRIIRAQGTQDYYSNSAFLKSEQKIIENIGSLERVLNFAAAHFPDHHIGKDYVGDTFFKETGKQLTDKDLDHLFNFFDLHHDKRKPK